MAIQRTKPGQSFLNKPIGVVNRNTGSQKIYEQEAKNFQQASNIALTYAKDLQIKEGQEFGRTVAVRDEDGKLSYPELPKSLGRMGTDAANQIMQKRYITAATNDLQQFANNAAISNRNPDDYKRVVSDYISKTSEEIERSGGASVIGAYSEAAYAYASQQASKIALENFRRSEAVAQENTISRLSQWATDTISDIDAGNISNLKGKRDAYYLQLEAGQIEDGLSARFVGDSKAVYSRNETTALFRLATRNMTAGEATKLEGALVRNPELREQYQGEVFDALFQSFDMSSRLQARGQTLSSVNQVVTQITSEQAAQTSIATGEEILSNKNGLIHDSGNTKLQKSVDAVMANKFGLTTARSYFTDEAVNTPEVLDALSQTQVLPRSLLIGMEEMATGAGGIEFEPQEVNNALVIYRSVVEGSPGKTVGMGKSTLSFFSKLSELSRFNPSAVDQNVLFSRATSLNDPDAINIIKTNAGVRGDSIEAITSNWVEENLEILPEHKQDMKVYAGSLLLAGSDVAADVAQNFYDQQYIKSRLLENGRDFHAPERYFDREGLDAFEGFVNNMLYTVPHFDNDGRAIIPVLGEDVKLRVERGAQNTAEYSLVDIAGNIIRSANGEAIRVGPAQIKARQNKVALITGLEIDTMFQQQLRNEALEEAMSPAFKPTAISLR